MIRILKLLFVLGYISVLIYTVFLARRRSVLSPEKVEENINWVPFKSITHVFYENILHGDSFVKKWFFFSNVFGNIMLFIPFPMFCFFLGFKRDNRSLLLIGILVSILIEVIQGALIVGIPDIDDVLLNTLGVYVGILILQVCKNTNGVKQFFSVE